MHNRCIAILLLSVAALAACSKKGSSPTFNDRPVVEAYLTSGLHTQVKISRQTANTDDVGTSADDINALTVYLDNGTTTVVLQPAGNGIYTDTTLPLTTGPVYTLRFMYNSQEVTATTSIPARPQNFVQSDTVIAIQKIDSTSGPFNFGSMPDPVELSWDNTDNSYYLVVAQNIETNPVLIRDTSSTRPSFAFRNQPMITNTTQLRPQQFQYFGRHLLILYHINPDYSTLYEASSNSSQSLSSPSTGITNGYGIFTGMSADTLHLQVNEQ